MEGSANSVSGVIEQIGQYRRRYYQNQLFKGLLLALALVGVVFLLFNTLEFYGRFNSAVRGLLLFGFFGALLFSLIKWVFLPLSQLYGIRSSLSDEDAARQIGTYFPEIGDKLLNTLQLRKLSGSNQELIEASIRQKSGQLMVVRFSEAIRFQENKRYLKYAIYPLALILVGLLLYPAFFIGSSERILHFDRSYSSAPFTLTLLNAGEPAIRNEDYQVRVKVDGDAIPKEVYLNNNGTRFKLNANDSQTFEYHFRNIQRDLSFTLDAAGYTSGPYKIAVVDKPALLSFDVDLRYPGYLQKGAENLKSVGNLTVPEGTRLGWLFSTASTSGLTLRFETDSVPVMASVAPAGKYRYQRVARKSGEYEIVMSNKFSSRQEKTSYFLNVIPDLPPQITLEVQEDTLLHNYVALGGAIKDDYGFSKLRLIYTVKRNSEEGPASGKKHIRIPFEKTANSQSYHLEWALDSLSLSPGDKIDYYVQVCDNDGVNGSKSAQSNPLTLTIPSRKVINEQIENAASEIEKQMEATVKKAGELERDLKNLEKSLKTDKSVDFQEQQLLKEIIKKRDEIKDDLRKMNEANRQANQQSSQFNRQSDVLKKKLEDLQSIMENLMNDENSKLYQELQQMMDQKQSERMSKLLERLRNREALSEKELDRMTELYKKMQLEGKMEQLAKQLGELAEKQETLAKKTESADAKRELGSKNDSTQLAKEQENLKNQLEEALESLKGIEELRKELGENQPLPKEEGESAKEDMNKSQAELANKQNKEAAKSQRNAAKKMRKMAQETTDAMAASQTAELEMNLDALRDILENLLKLSFDQESAMKSLRKISLADPRYLELGQKQLNLQDDAKIVEDSLNALARKVTQIQPFVTRELGDMKQYMNESLEGIKDRRIAVANSKQQFAMTSMNNLALMLSDIFNQMQEQLALAMSMPGKEGKPGDQPSASQMQKKLNEQIRQMGESKSGQQGQGAEMQAEELARMAAEQAAIRKKIQKMLNEQKGTNEPKKFGDQAGELMEDIEKSEADLVNKQIDRELIERNKKIEMRLLEAEKSAKVQGEDNKRKAEAARQHNRKTPPALEKYVRAKEQQTELLRSVPPGFSPFYKRQVHEYFKRHQPQQ